jgi:trehalose 6-phosphate synthase/phosphatase
MNMDTTKSYTNARRRLFLLDYDGTLANIAELPWEAKPTQEITDTLTRLTSDPQNTVVIVTGRKHEDMEEWFGHLPVSFAAEHGMLFKEPGQDWATVEGLDTAWKDIIRNLLQSYVDKFKGSFIEEKTNGLVWHYRTVKDQQAAEKAAKELAENLKVLAPTYYLRVMEGAKIVETQPLGVSKGTAAKRWLSQGGWDFVLVAGDDVSDEDMFKAAPETAFTIKVREGGTIARHRLAMPADLLDLLRSLS